MILHYYSNLLNQLALSLVVLPSYSSLREAVLSLQLFFKGVYCSYHEHLVVLMLVGAGWQSLPIPGVDSPTSPLLFVEQKGLHRYVGSAHFCHYYSY